jgi:purple acid phosphatase-like protein/calcineurin-like phosphoesterase family protein
MRILFIAIIVLSLFSCQRSAAPEQPQTVREVMDDVITRLYKEVPEARYDSIDDAFMLGFLTNEEKQVLATRYLYFSVNVPVTVSLMRHKSQATPPFWLAESGFVKTELVVKNVEDNEYEVWEKKFEAGTVELGINGFDKHRPVYFISVGKVNPSDSLQITDVYPSQYALDTMRVGAFTYHDWSSLLLTEVPEKLVGQVLFTTVRGRAREAHVVNGFRKTPFPSSSSPDQVMLTYSSSPQTTIDIQWRTDTTVTDGVARYWMEGSKDTLITSASRLTVQDRMLFNDRCIHRHTAALKDLKPGVNYGYQVGSKEKQLWSAPNSFKTEAVNTDKFSFVWFGDTHTFPDTTRLVSLAIQRNPDAAFYSIAGDLVSTGLNRDDWDKLFDHGSELFAHKPLMPVLGNHDRQDGMGAQLYYDLFSLPKNGPEKVEPEGSYSFEYGNALYIMIDCTSEVNDHTAWIESVLTNTKATWKFVMFHFPPYNFEEPYPDIQQAWGPLFDKYHVDMVMGGHVHYYMRSQPMFGGKVVDSFNKGTVYAISISIPWSHDSIGEEPYAVKRYPNGYYYQRMEIDGKVLKYTSVNIKGEVTDEFVIRK